MIDHLHDRASETDTAVVGLYCDFPARHEQTTPNMLGAILKQLVNRGEIPEHVRRALKTAREGFGGRRLRLPDLFELLKTTIASLPRVFICIDALDEALPKLRLDLLRFLRDIAQDSPNARLFLSGRDHITSEIRKGVSSGMVAVPIIPTKGGIKAFLEMRLDSDTEPNAMDDDLRADIMRVTVEEPSKT